MSAQHIPENAVDFGALPITALIKVITGTTYTILPGDAGYILCFTAGTQVIVTIPSGVGLSGLQCQLWNQCSAAVNVSLTGTITATGTNIAQKKSAMLMVRSEAWHGTGGLS